MENLQIRETEIFRILKLMVKTDFVLIGGYAANSYALPRFSVDCDIVVKNATPIVKILEANEYTQPKTMQDLPYDGKFLRFEKQVAENMTASVDILINEVHDRQSNATFSAEWVFQNSKKQRIVGKTIDEIIEARIITADALFVMKLASARVTDIRDLFMIVPKVKDNDWVRNECKRFFDYSKNYQLLLAKIQEKQFKDNLQGVYGYLDAVIFARHVTAIKKLGE